jgi:hypothetical protein
VTLKKGKEWHTLPWADNQVDAQGEINERSYSQ